MTRLFNDPASFAEDALAGFCDLHAARVRRVEGGVVRAVPSPQGSVAVVVGGGSGHYPAFHGLVGAGMAEGAVVGDVFTSPSSWAARSVARAAHRGGGVLFAFGNHPDAAENFGVARDRLLRDGIDCRAVAITDDIASAEAPSRRGGATGNFAVLKMAAAAADEGLVLDEVQRIAVLANERTRTLGVAADGRASSGRDGPLFAAPVGKIGPGVRGEPGSSDADFSTAAELADVVVDGVLAESPAGAGVRVGAVLNGLGRIGHEELFVLWSRIAARLRGAGLEIVEPESGELVTSLDTAGVSLTLVWLDEELERFWRASADAPAYRKRARPRAATVRAVPDRAPARVRVYPGALLESRRAATATASVLGEIHRVIEAHAEEIGRIDAVAADGGHGRSMVRGTGAAHEAALIAVRAGAGVRSALAEAGDAWAARAGGTSGVLWGTGVRAFAGELSDGEAPRAAELAAGVAAFAESIVRTGGAQPGDKTMVDAIAPFAAEIAGSGSWTRAAEAARAAAGETASLQPKGARTRPTAERSLGSPDPGAISFALIAETIAAALETTG
ncbi:dihydroxyacetone kinase family protein [Saccharopolyspora sp. NFXS83]|uniref:dihydroxyacetone kinase family protein n=1 Tax=Saccharopolyspora sp. NFXS83 TaxID=2993560 RepID=UPI00224A71B5|nr:dihydroxyacetone kinase family protein [Saccharopolyspora sp. NFXS83]MCX2731622.1 dihydroxyacetone kinase family protein [Saccharopolyspora sp. NFXS83]